MQAIYSTGLLPSTFENLFNAGLAPKVLLEQLLPLIAEALQADRCFLYLRNPWKEKGRIEFCYCRNPAVPDVKEPERKNDTEELPLVDPLFAAALQTKPSIYIADVSTADPAMVNRNFEEKTFGHRALIHAPITENGQLWGILQPAIFGVAPRMDFRRSAVD
ncbi:GAF domain-containing protein [Rhodocytophaga rosea]|uniref:GAF domain-containing protein n=1 Tax=Rhodocytophaga rosea TaxID=2704465 RepID=A0A6C0GMQ9_9BACT|nr:GAF domain-containing protein [Rhodocytophaga rosea]QHT68920.1 GAF domain-containing protein [Rhodocytophaga rosea]